MARRKSMNRGGKKLKSGLEIYCYDALKSNKFDFEYEPETFTLVESFRYPSTYFKSTPKKPTMSNNSGRMVLPITYTPDFVSHKHKFVIETKGYARQQHTFPLRWKLFLKYLTENDMADYMLFVPKNSKQVDATIQTIKDELQKAK